MKPNRIERLRRRERLELLPVKWILGTVIGAYAVMGIVYLLVQLLGGSVR